MVSCKKGPTRHAYAWQIGPFWQDTLNIWKLLYCPISCVLSACHPAESILMRLNSGWDPKLLHISMHISLPWALKMIMVFLVCGKGYKIFLVIYFYFADQSYQSYRNSLHSVEYLDNIWKVLLVWQGSPMWMLFKTSKPWQNGHHFAESIFKLYFFWMKTVVLWFELYQNVFPWAKSTMIQC